MEIMIIVIIMVLFLSSAISAFILNIKNNRLQKELLHEKESVRLKDELLSNISAEFNEPLNSIAGIVENIFEGKSGEISKNTASNLLIINNNIHKILKAANDITIFSMLKDNTIELNIVNLDMKQIVDFTIQIAEKGLGRKQIELVNKIDKATPLVKGDENRIISVLNNLLDNAIKYTYSGVIVVSAAVNGDKLEISVKDTGMGISKDMKKYIFSESLQLYRAKEMKSKGLGLGLLISKRLLELQKGDIWFESDMGKGACFTFSLPTSDSTDIPEYKYLNEKKKMDRMAEEFKESEAEDTEEIIEKNDNESVSNDKKEENECTNKILIVDDESINVQVLINHFSKWSQYELITAGDGEEALEIFEKTNGIQLVLLDVMMPKLSGYEVCKTIRKKYSKIDMPIILLTAKSSPDDIVYGFDCGANDYVPKPFTRKELLARVQTILDFKENYKKLSDALKSIKEKDDMLIKSEKMASLGVLVGSITHEIKNPINVILTNVEMLREDIKSLDKEILKKSDNVDYDELIDYVDSIFSATKQTRSILLNMMNYMREESKIERIFLKDLVESVSMLVKKELEKDRIEFVATINQDAYIDGNTGELIQILLNLIINSRDALNEKNPAKKKIEVSLSTEKNEMVLTIEDNGIGIKKENLEKMFNTQFTTKEKGKGTGMGMLVVKKLMEKNNIDVKVESNYNEGTKFFLGFKKGI